jgi:hypothetical protein
MSFDEVSLGFQIIWNEVEHGWQLVSTGATIPTPAIHAEIRRHAVLSGNLFNDITTSLYAAETNVAAWQNAMWAEIKEGRTANAIFGAGGVGNMSPEAIARLDARLAEEAGHLANFAQDIADGKVSELMARDRARQYAQGMESSYWEEWKQPLTGPGLDHLPILPTTPGNGDTPCHGKCQCTLLFTDAGIIWNLNPASHCTGCLDLAAGGPYRGR